MDNEARDKIEVIRERNKRKIQGMIEKLEQRKTSFTPKQVGVSWEEEREMEVLDWFDRAKRDYPRDEYERLVAIYESESMNKWEQDERATDGVPYLPEQFDILRDQIPRSQIRMGRRPDPKIEKRNQLIRKLRSQGLASQKICQELDRKKHSLPRGWKSTKITNWQDAYFNNELRANIHTLFSRASKG